ncbi:MAG: ABC transporter permease [Pseudonocardiaceae bacterium]
MRSLGHLLGRTPTWVGFLGRHLVGTVGVLIATSVASYALILLAPGDAARSLAVGRAGPGVTEEQVAAIRAQLSLDDPGYVQYARWLGDALTGDLGLSVRTGQSITGDLLERLPTTLFLALGAGAIALVVGVCTGAAGAVVRRAGWRSVLRLGALLGVSVPSFWLSYLLILVLTESLGLLPTSGQRGPGSWIMPWIVLALPVAGVLSRVVTVSLREALDQPYVVAAQARGSNPWSIVARDGLTGAAGSILSVSGLLLGLLVSGTLIVEQIFAWPGIGAYFIAAASFRDIPALQAAVLVFAIGFVTMNRLADLVHGLVDPRLRLPATG